METERQKRSLERTFTHSVTPHVAQFSYILAYYLDRSKPGKNGRLSFLNVRRLALSLLAESIGIYCYFLKVEGKKQMMDNNGDKAEGPFGSDAVRTCSSRSQNGESPGF